jgi:hypothetical protein
MVVNPDRERWTRDVGEKSERDFHCLFVVLQIKCGSNVVVYTMALDVDSLVIGGEDGGAASDTTAVSANEPGQLRHKVASFAK